MFYRPKCYIYLNRHRSSLDGRATDPLIDWDKTKDNLKTHLANCCLITLIFSNLSSKRPAYKIHFKLRGCEIFSCYTTKSTC